MVGLRAGVAVVVGAAVAAGSLGSVAGSSPVRAGTTACREVNVPVTLEGVSYRLGGRLCLPPGWPSRPLQVLLSGATYASPYWDFAVEPDRYSYVRAANAAGYATLAVDHLGVGDSDRPSFSQLSVPSHGRALHQLVQHLRAGGIGGVRPQRVVVVGHSLGSFVAQWEAAQYGDVDALVLSSALRAEPVGAPAVAASLVPAELEPRLAGRPPGYLTTRTGTRGALFYNPDVAEPAVVTADEASRETTSPSELASLGDATDPGVAAAIDVPVLLALGEFDNLWCPSGCASPDGPLAQEVSYFGAAPRVDTFVLANAGHVLNLHPNAAHWFAAANCWVDAVFAPHRSRQQEASSG